MSDSISFPEPKLLEIFSIYTIIIFSQDFFFFSLIGEVDSAS